MGESENPGQQPKAEEAEVTAAAAEADAAAQPATSDPGIKYQGGPTQAPPASGPDIKYQG